MRILQYHPVDVINGPGTRCSVFVSGCEHRCPDCFNKASWSFKKGEAYSEQIKQRILCDLGDQRIRKRGLSLSGGDPLHPRNLAAVTDLVEAVKTQYPDKDIWCWTGYRLEQLEGAQLTLLDCLDVLVDGRFEAEFKDARLCWRGSSNQRIIALSQRYANEPYSCTIADISKRQTRQTQ
ncbi:anaerobic ribonucleoside-triphosphate reductase-activating protein [Agaribacterium haliotis]|uniref:anaerobic ribonucleoside-triphosphate reductase-activating protein n=1 Tax=Agaribacterium haliotis TaxID=2013869 RepID=UPI000BB54FA3|nr:anaerobic ribonucleoside-triphosphate reductase-activating protein [Agaribacterium haliotis]